MIEPNSQVLKAESKIEVRSHGHQVCSSTASTSLALIDLTSSGFENHRNSDEKYFDFPFDEWICLHKAYFALW